MNIKVQNQNNILSSIIRKADSNSVSYDSGKEKLVLVDSTGRSFMQKPRGLNWLTSYKYFLVNYDQTIEFSGYLYTLYYNGGSSNVLISFKIKCNVKDVQTLVEKAYTSINEPADIYSNIQNEIENFDRRSVLSDNFYSKKQVIESAIAERLNSFGLTVLELNLSLEGSKEKLKSNEINVSGKVRFQNIIPLAKFALSGNITVIPGQEAKALAKELLIDIIEEEIISIARKYLFQNVSPEEFYKDYNSSIRIQVERQINEYLKDYGREITDLLITISKNGTLDAITIASNGGINIRVTNSHQLLQLSYKCELLADPLAHARVYLFDTNTPEIEEVILDQVKNTFAKDINLEEFAIGLNTTVSSKLATVINDKIISWGRTVGYLQLETYTKLPPQYVEITYAVDCITKDGSPIKVNNTVLLQKDYDNHKVFEASQILDYKLWLEKELDRINKNYIIGKTYNELKYKFQGNEIKNELEKEVVKLGYKVNQLVTIPEFEGRPLGDKFNIKYQDDYLSSKVDGIYLAISIHIDGKIIDWDKALMLLAPKESIIDSIRNAIGIKLKQFFHSVDPDRFYLRFYIKKGEEKTLEEEIKELLTKTISNDYGAEIREIVVNQANTRLIKRLRELQQGMCYCEFHDGSGTLHYKTTIVILGIAPDSWSIFSARDYKLRSEEKINIYGGEKDTERNDIKQHVKDYLENLLNYIIVPNINNGTLTKTSDLALEIEKSLTILYDQIRNSFGLNIEIYRPVKIDLEGDVNFKKRASIAIKETAGIDTNVSLFKLSVEERKTRLTELYEQRREKKDYPLNSPDLQAINEEIKQLESEEYSKYSSLESTNPYANLLDSGSNDAKQKSEDTKEMKTNSNQEQQHLQ